MTEHLHFRFSLSCIGEGNGNPPQCSCLENPRDGGACWAAVYGFSQSQTRLKWLSSSSSSLQVKNEKKRKEGDGRDRLIQLIDLEVIHTTFLHPLQVWTSHLPIPRWWESRKSSSWVAKNFYQQLFTMKGRAQISCGQPAIYPIPVKILVEHKRMKIIA